MTVSKTRHRHQPKTSHHLQETSQARFLHLDKTKVKSRIGQGIGDGEVDRRPSIPARNSATATEDCKRQPAG